MQNERRCGSMGRRQPGRRIIIDPWVEAPGTKGHQIPASSYHYLRRSRNWNDDRMDEEFTRYVRRLQALKNPVPRILFLVCAILTFALLYLGVRSLMPRRCDLPWASSQSEWPSSRCVRGALD